MRFTLLGNVRVGNLVYWGYVCVWTILNQHKLENSRRRSLACKADTKNLREASQNSRFLVKNKSNPSNEVIIIGLPPSSREDPLGRWGLRGVLVLTFPKETEFLMLLLVLPVYTTVFSFLHFPYIKTVTVTLPCTNSKTQKCICYLDLLVLAV